MIALAPDLVIAFRNSGSSPGTDDMLRVADQNQVAWELYIDGVGWQELAVVMMDGGE